MEEYIVVHIWTQFTQIKFDHCINFDLESPYFEDLYHDSKGAIVVFVRVWKTMHSTTIIGKQIAFVPYFTVFVRFYSTKEMQYINQTPKKRIE